MLESDNDGSTFSDSEPATPKAKPFTQGQLNDLITDLSIPKKAAELLASRISEHGALHSNARITFDRKRDEVRYSFCVLVKKMTLSFVTM